MTPATVPAGLLGTVLSLQIELEQNALVLKAKELIGHGSFGQYLQSEFDMTERTAQRYMAAAERFGGKSDTVSNLPPTLVYKLAAKSTPEDVVRQVIERSHNGRPMLAEEVQALLTAWVPKEKSRPRQSPTKAEELDAEYHEETGLAGEQEAAREAAALIRDVIGSELERLLELLSRCDVCDVVVHLRTFAAEHC
jgi:hypothetical protein